MKYIALIVSLLMLAGCGTVSKLWNKKKDEIKPEMYDIMPPKVEEPNSNVESDLPSASFSRSAYSLDDYRSMPVHEVTMTIHGHNLTTRGEALKISQAFGMGCEITWWFKWDGKTHARVIEGYRAGDCADGTATKDIPAGWYPFRGCGYYHGDAHTETTEALTWFDVEKDSRGENLGYSASKVVSKRNNAKAWRSGIVMPTEER